jgi:hypothetical protein
VRRGRKFSCRCSICRLHLSFVFASASRVESSDVSAEDPFLPPSSPPFSGLPSYKCYKSAWALSLSLVSCSRVPSYRRQPQAVWSMARDGGDSTPRPSLSEQREFQRRGDLLYTYRLDFTLCTLSQVSQVQTCRRLEPRFPDRFLPPPLLVSLTRPSYSSTYSTRGTRSDSDLPHCLSWLTL